VTMPETATKATRLDRATRREQLLSAARKVVAERGVAGFTMESLAAAAGVNKALPYRHFDNAEAVLNELYRQFNFEIGSRVLDAARQARTVDDRIRRVIGAYLDCVFDNVDLLSVLASPGSPPRSPFEDPRVGIRQFGFDERDAWAAASVIQGALAGGVDTIAHREAAREQVEETLSVVLAALVRRYGGEAPATP
jgi:AcrR family transcriptional regulator